MGVHQADRDPGDGGHAGGHAGHVIDNIYNYLQLSTTIYNYLQLSTYNYLPLSTGAHRDGGDSLRRHLARDAVSTLPLPSILTQVALASWQPYISFGEVGSFSSTFHLP